MYNPGENICIMTKFYKCLIFIFLILVLTVSACNAKILKGEVDINWPLLNQTERAKIIDYYKNILFKEVKYKTDKKQFKNYRKDPQSRENRAFLKSNIRKLDDREIAGFYVFRKILYIYGVKYKKDKYHIYYYNALGHLAYVDILNGPYDKFPYIAYQYRKNGKLAGISYYISDYDQYIFNAKGKFKGRWYYSRLYDKKAKIIMTRKLP